jgi:hypothetical protein
MWQHLRPDVQEALKVALERTSRSMNEESVSTVILSLGNLNINWNEDLGESLKVALIDAIIKQFRYGETSLSRYTYMYVYIHIYIYIYIYINICI